VQTAKRLSRHLARGGGVRHECQRLTVGIVHGRPRSARVGAVISAGDAAKAAALCERSLALAPYDQVALAILGTAWRMQQDERDEILNGYDSLIQIHDLDPPEGFPDMESFNAELNAWLDRAHPATREYLEQSLRNGTQTPDRLFGAGHDLVERLQIRIREGITSYIAGMKQDGSLNALAVKWLKQPLPKDF